GLRVHADSDGDGDAGAGGEGATVRVATFLGGLTRLHLVCDSGAEAKVDLPSWEADSLTPGAHCRLTPHENPVLVVEPD
ncbi:TOBE domain-containing protein, partial [Streptomyces oryzae]